jgi:hypothetical protein
MILYINRYCSVNTLCPLIGLKNLWVSFLYQYPNPKGMGYAIKLKKAELHLILTAVFKIGLTRKCYFQSGITPNQCSQLIYLLITLIPFIFKVGFFKEPKDIFKEPKGIFKEPKGIFKEPKGSLKESKDILKEPKASFKKSKDIFKEPKGSFKEPKGSFKESKGSFKKPKGSLKMSLVLLQKSTYLNITGMNSRRSLDTNEVVSIGNVAKNQ